MPDAARVLVVDDSPTIRRVVGSVLQRAGHEVVTAESGDQGLVEIAAFDPDIVLLDVVMPGMGGLEVLERIDEQFGDEGPPVILMCTRTDQVPTVDREMRRRGVVDTITKPFSPEALLAVVHHSLEKHGRRQRTSDATRVVMALASIAAASDHDMQVEGETRVNNARNTFSDDERTTPGGRLMASGGATVIQSTYGVPVSPPMPLPAGVALMGDLTIIALPEVLQLLKFQSHTGLLEVEAGGLRFEVGFIGGAIVSVHARDEDGGPPRQGQMLLGRYLVTAGLVDEAALDAQLLASSPHPIGERLVEAGVITGDELRRTVAEQAQDLLVELLRARRGVFALKMGDTLLPATAIRPGWSVDALMFEALRRIDEWGVIESEVPSFEARFAVRGTLDETGLSAEEASLLRSLVRGPARVRDLVKRSSLLPFDVCRVVYRLSVLKRVQRIDDGDASRLVNDDQTPREPVLSTPPVAASKARP